MTDGAINHYMKIINSEAEKIRFFLMMELDDELSYTDSETYSELTQRRILKLLLANPDLVRLFKPESKARANFFLRNYYISLTETDNQE